MVTVVSDSNPLKQLSNWLKCFLESFQTQIEAY